MTTVSEATKFYVFTSDTHYNDIYSVEPYCVEKTVNFLSKHIDPSRIKLVKGADELNTFLSAAKGGCLVIPGGYFGFLIGDLKKSIATIQAFVHRGGAFAGFCSGGLLGCTELTSGTTTLGKEQGLLCLLPIRARCFSHPKKRIDGVDNGRIVTILTERDVRIKAYESEGHYYELLKLIPGLKAEAAFANEKDQPIGAVSGTYGKGKVFCAGFHVEFDPPEDAKPEEGEKTDDKKASDDSKNNTEKPTIDPEHTKRDNFLGGIVKSLDSDSPKK